MSSPQNGDIRTINYEILVRGCIDSGAWIGAHVKKLRQMWFNGKWGEYPDPDGRIICEPVPLDGVDDLIGTDSGELLAVSTELLGAKAVLAERAERIAVLDGELAEAKAEIAALKDAIEAAAQEGTELLAAARAETAQAEQRLAGVAAELERTRHDLARADQQLAAIVAATDGKAAD